MMLHEHQAKALLREAGVAVPRGLVARTPEEASAAARILEGRVAVKAQVLAGGRGKAGGIRLAASAEEAERAAAEILAKSLATHQSGARALPVRAVLVEEAVSIARELYLAAAVDRSRARAAWVASPEGGVEIEALAAREPRKVLREAFDPPAPWPFQRRRIARHLGIDPKKLDPFLDAASRIFFERDLVLLEFNPLAVTAGGDLVALDAKINADDSALFRQRAIDTLRDPEDEDALERRAREADLSYVRLDGTIGCMVNGAGLAMATMDLIRLAGGDPANFLDVGGGADVKRIETAFRIILDDPRVRSVLVNIFGGIVRCDRVADGIVQALAGVDLRVPLVVRLEGTKAEEGFARLAAADLPFLHVRGLEEAAREAVRAGRGPGGH